MNHFIRPFRFSSFLAAILFLCLTIDTSFVQRTARPMALCPPMGDFTTSTLLPTCPEANGSITIDFNNVAANGVVYTVYYSVNGGPQTIVQVTGQNESIIVPNLGPGFYTMSLSADFLETVDNEDDCFSGNFFFEISCVLPVHLLSFTGKSMEGKVLLGWTTTWEQTNSGFHIQKSTDGVGWEGVGFVKGTGTTEQKTTYSFTDSEVSLGRTYYYRLKQLDENGQSEFSKIIALSVTDGTQQIHVFPNPNTDGRFTIVAEESDRIEVRMLSLSGHEIPVQLQKTGNRWEISAKGPLPTGTYSILVTNPVQMLRKSFKVVVNNPN
jgi:hypothetical protein